MWTAGSDATHFTSLKRSGLELAQNMKAGYRLEVELQGLDAENMGPKPTMVAQECKGKAYTG